MSPLFRRRVRLREVAGFHLDHRERVLAMSSTLTGAIVATSHRLFVPTADGPHPIGWENIERASWDGGQQKLVVAETSSQVGRPRRYEVDFGEPAPVLDVIREQVKASLVISRHMPITGERGVRVSGRRRPGQRGLIWVVTLDRGIDLDDPHTRAHVEAAVDDVRAEVE